MSGTARKDNPEVEKLSTHEKALYYKMLDELERGVGGKPETSRPKTSNRVLALLGLFLLAFIATMIVTYWVKGAVPDTLIQYTLGAGGVEALLLAGIKISKVIAGDKPGESEAP